MAPLLEVTALRVGYPGGAEALRGVSFRLDAGESLAVVGETGSGKSTLAMSLVGRLQPPLAEGSIRFQGQELIGESPEALRRLRWRQVALALQGAPFNPVVKVGDQIAEPLVEHLGAGTSAARRRARELAEEVLLPPSLLERFPHQLSGGERRRAMLAMVLALDPSLVVLDEPTAGLDSITREELVRRVAALREARGFALLLVSHDLADAADLAERCMVLYAGEVMEEGDTAEVLGTPRHPYSWALLNAYPVMSTAKDLRPIRGQPPDPTELPPGCSFNPRCTQAEAVCSSVRPALARSGSSAVACHFGGLRTLLSAERVSKQYRLGTEVVGALYEVSLSLREGESVGVIGPSGSGKSTLARILSGYLAPDSGNVVLEGEPMPRAWRRATRELRRRVQLVMQDPFEALSPRLVVAEILEEAIAGGGPRSGRSGQFHHLLQSVGLPTSESFLSSRCHQLSGGQLQRVALARALLAGPKVLVADEPTSMLDASEQARLLVVLRERQVEMGLGLVVVSHDLAVVRKITDRIVVLEGGRLVEEGPSSELSASPASLTGRRLLESARSFDRLGALKAPASTTEPAEKEVTGG